MQDKTNVLGSMFCVGLSNVQRFAGVFFLIVLLNIRLKLVNPSQIQFGRTKALIPVDKKRNT